MRSRKLLFAIFNLRAARLAIAMVFLFLSIQCIVGQEMRPLGEHRLTPVNEFARENELIRATVHVGGEDRVFIVDTGATANFYDENLRASCGNLMGERVVRSGYGQLDLSFFEAADAYVGNRNLRLGPIGILDLAELSSIVGGEVSGILGVPFLADVVLGHQEVDESYYVGSSYFRRFDATFQIALESGYITTDDIEIPSPADRFIIDTGMNSPISLSSEHFDEAEAAGLLYGVTHSSIFTITGPVTKRNGFLRSASLWKHIFTDVPVSESTQDKVGLGLIQKFDFRINLPGRTIEVSTNRKTDKPFLYDRSGISLHSVCGRILIERIKESSPGQSAGLSKSEAIVTVNGNTVDSSWVALCNARAALSNPDASEVELTIRNGDRERVVIVRLSPKPIAP